MRRYGLKYHVVGGFSFYERAEIKDMISYLKVILNPDDTISLLRVINTPTRGIGKGTIDTLERIALETGLSLWGAIGEAIQRQLLPPRALAALKSFQQLIEDGRAMLRRKFAEQLPERRRAVARDRAAGSIRPVGTAARDCPAERSSAVLRRAEEDATAFDPTEFGNFSFDFGADDSDEPRRHSRERSTG